MWRVCFHRFHVRLSDVRVIQDLEVEAVSLDLVQQFSNSFIRQTSASGFEERWEKWWRGFNHFFIVHCYLKIKYNKHLNTGLVWYSNGRFVSGCQTVRYSNVGLKNGQKKPDIEVPTLGGIHRWRHASLDNFYWMKYIKWYQLLLCFLFDN